MLDLLLTYVSVCVYRCLAWLGSARLGSVRVDRPVPQCHAKRGGQHVQEGRKEKKKKNRIMQREAVD